MEKKTVPVVLPSGPNFQVISLDRLLDPARPMRHDLSPEAVADLVVSIRQVGLIEPLVVRPKDEYFEVVAGHRRLMASEMAKLAQVPCYVVAANDEQAELLKIHENLYRQEISPSEEAEHYHYLIQHLKLSPAKIASLIGKSMGYVTDRLDILTWPDVLRESLEKNEIKFSVAKEFSRLPDRGKMVQYLRYAIQNGLTSDGARKWVDEALRPVNNAPPAEAAGVAETPVYDAVSTCVYCNKPVKLVEATMVYLHDDCFKAVAPN